MAGLLDLINGLRFPDKQLSEEGRGLLLPYRKTDQGTEFAVPGLLASMINAFTAPSRSMQGELVADENGALRPSFNQQQEAMNFAGSLLGGGAAGGAVLPSQGKGLLGITAYKNSKSTAERALLQSKLKEYGLPATGSNEKLKNMVRIIESDPKKWTRQDFDEIAPHLSIHQDLHPGSQERVASIMGEGLQRGMVDNLAAVASGGKQWSFARGLRGKDAYLLPTGKIVYRSKDSPWMAPGNKPLIHFSADESGDIFESIIKNATKNK